MAYCFIPSTCVQSKANALRRTRRFDLALAELNAALSAAPRFARAFEDLGLLHMDRGAPLEALHAFETLLHLDRDFPGIDDWIVRASAEVNRDDLAKAAVRGARKRILMRHSTADHTASFGRLLVHNYICPPCADEHLNSSCLILLVFLLGRLRTWVVLSLRWRICPQIACRRTRQPPSAQTPSNNLPM